jgi:hypothetical protein
MRRTLPPQGLFGDRVLTYRRSDDTTLGITPTSCYSLSRLRVYRRNKKLFLPLTISSFTRLYHCVVPVLTTFETTDSTQQYRQSSLSAIMYIDQDFVAEATLFPPTTTRPALLPTANPSPTPLPTIVPTIPKVHFETIGDPGKVTLW